MLFESEGHEPLLEIAWNEARARQVIQSIADDTERARCTSGKWPLHPLDDDGDEPPSRR
jgi:hypothetical protein